MKEKAESLLDLALSRLMDISGIIFSFRHVATIGLPAATESLSRTHGMLAPIIVTQEPLFKDEPVQEIANTLTDSTLQESQASIDAATIIFAHAFFDDYLTRMLTVLSMLNRDAFISRIEEGKITVKEVREKGIELVVSERILRKLKQLERESLAKRLSVLFTVCPPSRTEKLNALQRHGDKEYKFALERIRTIDDFRHSLIHSGSLGQPIPDAEEDSQYLMRTAMYLALLIYEEFNLTVDMSDYLSHFVDDESDESLDGSSSTAS